MKISKAVKAFIVLSALLLTLTACSDKKEESEASRKTTQAEETFEPETTQTEATQEITEIEETDSEETQKNGELELAYEGETKEIGEEKFGFIQVPENWVRFIEEDSDDSVPLYQYSSSDTFNVVTMSYVENIDAKTLADSYYYSFSNDNVEGLTGATVELDGRTSYQVYGFFSDENKILVSWIFEGDDGLTHTLSIESADYDIISLSSTYRLH